MKGGGCLENQCRLKSSRIGACWWRKKWYRKHLGFVWNYLFSARGESNHFQRENKAVQSILARHWASSLKAILHQLCSFLSSSMSVWYCPVLFPTLQSLSIFMPYQRPLLFLSLLLRHSYLEVATLCFHPRLLSMHILHKYNPCALLYWKTGKKWRVGIA